MRTFFSILLTIVGLICTAGFILLILAQLDITTPITKDLNPNKDNTAILLAYSMLLASIIIAILPTLIFFLNRRDTHLRNKKKRR